MFLLLAKLTAFTFVTVIWTLVFSVYLFSRRPDGNTTEGIIIVAFLIVMAIALTWLVKRFYFSRSGQNSVYLIAIDTLIVTAANLVIFWLVPDIIALFENFGGDLPGVTQLAIIIYPYIMLQPLIALLILLLSVRAQQVQIQAVLLRLSHSLLALSSGTIVFYIGAVYAPIIFMCCAI